MLVVPATGGVVGLLVVDRAFFACGFLRERLRGQ